MLFELPPQYSILRLFQVSNLANASSLIYNALLSFPLHFGGDEKAVNWCGKDPAELITTFKLRARSEGFYLNSTSFPSPRFMKGSEEVPKLNRLLLGPFCGKPACQFINTTPGKARGVCADAFLQRKTLVVADVNSYPGHIACDGETSSEIVCPLILQRDAGDVVLGVLDLDCLALSGFTEEDRIGLEKIAKLIVRSCDW
jgi:L-methionine (R)-S-oxide reductase